MIWKNLWLCHTATTTSPHNWLTNWLSKRLRTHLIDSQTEWMNERTNDKWMRWLTDPWIIWKADSLLEKRWLILWLSDFLFPLCSSSSSCFCVCYCWCNWIQHSSKPTTKTTLNELKNYIFIKRIYWEIMRSVLHLILFMCTYISLNMLFSFVVVGGKVSANDNIKTKQQRFTIENYTRSGCDWPDVCWLVWHYFWRPAWHFSFTIFISFFLFVLREVCIFILRRDILHFWFYWYVGLLLEVASTGMASGDWA